MGGDEGIGEVGAKGGWREGQGRCRGSEGRESCEGTWPFAGTILTDSIGPKAPTASKTSSNSLGDTELSWSARDGTLTAAIIAGAAPPAMMTADPRPMSAG